MEDKVSFAASIHLRWGSGLQFPARCARPTILLQRNNFWDTDHLSKTFNTTTTTDSLSTPIHILSDEMAKTKPSSGSGKSKKSSKSGEKKPKKSPETLLLEAAVFLQTSQPEEAL